MIVALDLETTGLSKENDSIIEIALIKFDENTFEIIDEYSTFINPGISIPDLNVNITGITDEMVGDAPSLISVSDFILDFIGDSPILGHNTYFDRDFLIEKGIDINKNIVLDTFFLANFLSIKCMSMSLESLAAFYNIELIGAHRAYNDTKSTMYLFKSLLTECKNLPQNKKDLLNFLFSNCDDKNTTYLKEFLFKEENKLNNNEFENLLLKNLYISNNSNKKYKDSVLKNVEEYFSMLPNFENRENQIEMAKTIYNNFFENKKTVIEAPTGIGKTIAYLIPSIIYSKKTDSKVYISTKTKILQDQLFYKDLDLLSNALGINFNYTKIKGKNNYISIMSFFDFISEFGIDYEKLSFLSKLTMWLFETRFGELDEIFYTSNEYKFLKYINSESKLVLSDKNKYLKYEFVYKQKLNLDVSNIVIINHSLLFVDLKNDFNYFGNIDNLIIDEAHSIEDIATECMKKSFSYKIIEDILKYSENTFKNNFIDQSLLSSKKEDLIFTSKTFFEIFESYLLDKKNNDNYLINKLLDDDFYNKQDETFILIGDKLKLVLTSIKDLLIGTKLDFSRELNSINLIIDIVDKIIDKNNNKEFIKIAYYSDYEGVKLEYTILDIGNDLKNNFWDDLTNCFLFSATLSISNDFSYIKKSLQLENFGFKQFETDFDYSKQAILYLPKDIGNIKNNFGKVQDFLKELFISLKGNTLVLFTSIAAIRNTYINLNFSVNSIGSKILAQSLYGSKNKLLNTFYTNPNNSIILGTDSFWEGVDIPGDSLKYLIIHKMPFAVPTDPIYIARSKLFLNPFSEYSIPKSILKLKQGFGRLIRTKNDTGVVIFLDDRIYSTDWGKIFLKAFPNNINLKILKTEDIIKNLNLQ